MSPLRPRPVVVTAACAVLGLAGAAAAAVAVHPEFLPGVAAYTATHDVGASTAATAATAIPPATPRAHCGPGSLPETGRQGRVPLADYTSGRAAKGYTCNATQIGHIGSTGGFKTFRYVDTAGRVCAFYDGTLLFPTSVFHNQESGGTVVLDMSDPARPIETDRLRTPAM
ncbi:MAG: hypothetical protein QOF18_2146, partial [Frankiaceae bacterium]|nr:hypothetical protein [Frankiaceae bacterium]